MGANPKWSQIADEVRAHCATAGLDIVHPFAVGWYNRAVEATYRLPDFARASTLGLLIGNTRALWPRFVEALRAEPARVDDPHPIERYAADAVDAALRALPVRWEARGSAEEPPRRVAMQRLAQLSGLAHVSASSLSVHPVFGPWIALRAAVVVDVDGPAGPAPRLVDPCGGCPESCLAAFDRARASLADGDAHVEVARGWSLWVEVRDACAVGRAHRYDDEQIRYHYTKDRAVLRRLASARSS